MYPLISDLQRNRPFFRDVHAADRIAHKLS